MDTDLQNKLQETKEWLRKEYVGIRTGQASPALLDNVKVESYGSHVPLNQVGTVGVEDARTLRISIWDTSQLAGVEQSIREADLGVSLVTDSSGLRVIFPELTSERRVQLLKLAKNKLEESRIAVRSTRDEAMKQIEKSSKAGDISEDEMFSQKEAVQASIDKTNKELEQLFDSKESELNK
ncbi:ribosome recycling factor [Candidatus Nomurabacteria bacterium]|nr:ribosome recycling factor [Candidatus Kaiserbacteria bacterium]MCB9814961.1 ribosome recycling factor [Candidatus Nomurabacteria bacterium]